MKKRGLTVIALRNDAFRTSMNPTLGKVMLTASVADSLDRDHIIKAVRVFQTFNADNDPYGEHDFGAVDVNGERYFFKIDYYDENFQYFKQDGHLVLTIMPASEY